MLSNKRIPLLYILKKVKFDVLLVISFTTIVIISKQYFHIPFDLPVTIPAFLGTAITLVLAFKLNQSYDRWWEARKIWGSIVNDSRSLALQFLSFTKDKSHTEIEKNIRRQIAWCYALANSLRVTKDFSRVENILNDEYKKIKNSSNIPLSISNKIAQSNRDLFIEEQLNEYQQIQIDKTLVRLVASMGKAERIKNTVFPKTYRIFLRFFIYIFLLTLAVSLSELNPAFEIPLLVTISLPFFLLKKTSVHMQDPFENKPTDISVLAISELIEVNLKELIGDFSDVDSDSKFDFYVM